jgi:hypothetical protein
MPGRLPYSTIRQPQPRAQAAQLKIAQYDAQISQYRATPAGPGSGSLVSD